ncbi:uL15m family ribosomal protein, partial [Duncaniella muris]
RTEYKAVNLVDLERLAETAGIEKIGVAELVAAGLINGKQPVKILATGRLTRKLAVEANAFSAAAEKAIVEAGGSVTKI